MFCYYYLPPALTSPLFPYTTLFRSVGVGLVIAGYGVLGAVGAISAAVTAAYFVPRIPVELRVQAETAEPPSFAEALQRSEEHTSELQSLRHLVCRLLLEKKKKTTKN